MFCDVFLSKVIGATTWRDGCINLKVSDMATASDEAFTYLLIENYWDNWATLDLETYKNETTYENNSTKKKKGRQLGENIPKMRMVQGILVVGRMKGG